MTYVCVQIVSKANHLGGSLDPHAGENLAGLQEKDFMQLPVPASVDAAVRYIRAHAAISTVCCLPSEAACWFVSLTK